MANGLRDIEVKSLTIRMIYANFDGPLGTATGRARSCRNLRRRVAGGCAPAVEDRCSLSVSKRPPGRPSFVYGHRVGRPRYCRPPWRRFPSRCWFI